MAYFPASSLWPGRDRAPFFRLAASLMGASSTVATALGLVAFLVAGMTEQTAEGVVRVTAQSALTLSALVLVFTLTFGLAGVALLWLRARRGAMAWAVTGGVAGAAAGALFAAVAMSGVSLPVVIAFALTGWALFLLIRLYAGVRSAAPGRHRRADAMGAEGPVGLSNG